MSHFCMDTLTYRLIKSLIIGLPFYLYWLAHLESVAFLRRPMAICLALQPCRQRPHRKAECTGTAGASPETLFCDTQVTWNWRFAAALYQCCESFFLDKRSSGSRIMDFSGALQCLELGSLTHAPGYCHGGKIIPTFLFAAKQNFNKGSWLLAWWAAGEPGLQVEAARLPAAEGGITWVARPVTLKSLSMKAGALPSTLLTFLGVLLRWAACFFQITIFANTGSCTPWF